MTEAEARAALAAFNGLGGLERWIAEQRPWQANPAGWTVPGDLQGEAPMSDEPVGWIHDAAGAWTRTLHGLLLRVTPDPDVPDEPWIWEALEPAEDNPAVEYEIGLGGAETKEAAMARAEAAARAYSQQADR